MTAEEWPAAPTYTPDWHDRTDELDPEETAALYDRLGIPWGRR